MTSSLLSLKDAADLLGVHYMTAYRYVRTGRLPAVKEGARWQVRPEDLAALLDTPTADHPPSPRRARRGEADYVERLKKRLVNGDESGAWAVVQEAMTAGADPAGIYLELLTPTLQLIGDEWESGTISVAQEHQASAVTLRLIGRLGPQLRRPGRLRGSVLLGAPPHDHHSVPVALLGDLLRVRGFRVADLGGDVPAASFAETAAATDRLVAVGICATTADNEDNIEHAVRAVRAVTAAPVLLGGGAISGAEHARSLGASEYADDARHALVLFEELAARRTEPRPG
jgi:excisionase family DNA binding protein